MNLLEKSQDMHKRAQAVQRWKDRMNVLKARGITQTDFCKRNGIDRVTLSRYLNDIVSPGSWERINEIERAFESEGV